MSKMSEKIRRQPLPDYEPLFNEMSDELRRKPIKLLLNIWRSNFFKIILSSFMYIVKACGTWIIPIMTANIINEITYYNENSMRNILINFGVIVLVLAQNTPTHVIYSKYINNMLRSIGSGLRNTLLRKLQHLSISYHKEMESGRVHSKFIRDIEAIEFFNAHLIKSIIPALIGVIISMCISGTKSIEITIFYVIVVPVNVLIITAFRKRMRENNYRFRKEHENVSANVATMIEMIPVTKAHGLENEEIQKLEQNIKNLKAEGLVFDRTNAYFASFVWVAGQLLSALCLLFSGYLAIKGRIGIGDIVLYQSYFSSISAAVQTLVNVYPELTKGIESVRSVSEIALSDMIEDNRDKIRLKYVHGSLDFENVSYKYPNAEKETIKNFTLSVNPGECVAFVGASGSGKSTIMNMTIGFLQPSAGVFKVDGKPIDCLDLTSYRSFISVVPQNTILFRGTIRDNIKYGIPNVSDELFNRVIEAANINEFTDRLPNGLDTVVGEHGDKLSGGQKQRISIARALIRDPKILILDEATSALDNASERHVQKAISNLIKDRTTFIVAHRLSTIRDADKIVVLDKGEIVEMGTYEELMALQGKFYELKKLSEFDVE